MSGGRAREVGSKSFVSGGMAGPDAAPAVGAPWFVQFWPLFILFLMLASIAASVATVFVAYHHADEDVRQADSLDETRR